MKILVAIKRVIDHNVRIFVKLDGSGIEENNSKMVINPPDENAIEEAVKIKETNENVATIVVSIGDEKVTESLRIALAMGVDRAIHIKHDKVIEPLAVAKLLQKIVDKESPDLILLGKQAIDDDCNQTGQMLAALTDLPQATFASQIYLSDNTAKVVRETDEGLLTLKVTLPAIITTDLRLNTPRQPTLPNILKAKQKPLECFESSELGVDTKLRCLVPHSNHTDCLKIS